MLGQGLVGVALDYGGSRVGLGLTSPAFTNQATTRVQKRRRFPPKRASRR